MKFETLLPHGAEAVRWREYLAKLDPMRVDVHYTPEYARVQEVNAQTVLCVGRDGDRFILQPFSLRRSTIAGQEVLDLESPYGYGGPLAHGWNDPADGYLDFTAALFGWAKSTGVVSERSVLHPFNLDHQQWMMRRHDQPLARKAIVYVFLGGDWQRCYRDNRKAGLKIAKKAGVYVIQAPPTDENLRTFAALYRQTMERRGAAPRWLFSDEYFAAHFDQMENARLFFAKVDGEVEVATLAVFSRSTAHYHFSGSALRHPKAEANVAMIDALAEWGARMGCHRLHLGGGATSSPDDSLLAFKASFSPYRAPVYTDEAIINAERYADLCRATNVDPTGDFFPAYRAHA